jgi:hypothetical protein
MQHITNWSEAILGSLTGAASMFFAAVPRLMGFAVVLVAGWLIASLIEKGVVTVLRAARSMSWRIAARATAPDAACGP